MQGTHESDECAATLEYGIRDEDTKTVQNMSRYNVDALCRVETLLHGVPLQVSAVW